MPSYINVPEGDRHHDMEAVRQMKEEKTVRKIENERRITSYTVCFFSNATLHYSIILKVIEMIEF